MSRPLRPPEGPSPRAKVLGWYQLAQGKGEQEAPAQREGAYPPQAGRLPPKAGRLHPKPGRTGSRANASRVLSPAPGGGPRCAEEPGWPRRCLLPAPAPCTPRLARCAPPPPWPATFNSSLRAAAIGSNPHRTNWTCGGVLNGGVSLCVTAGKGAREGRSSAL